MMDSDEPMEVTLSTEVEPNAKGFTIAGGGTEGIIVSEVTQQSPQSNIFCIKEGDQLLSATIYFDNIAYEDAISILQHSEPYRVEFQLKRKLGKEDREKMQSIVQLKKERTIQGKEDPTIASEITEEQTVRRRENKKKRSKKDRLSWPKFQSLTNTRFLGHRRSRSTSETNEDETLDISGKVTEANLNDDEIFVSGKEQQHRQEFSGIDIHSRTTTTFNKQKTSMKNRKETCDRSKEKRSLDSSIHVQVEHHDTPKTQMKKGLSLQSTITSSSRETGNLERKNLHPDVEVIIVKQKNLPSPCKVSPIQRKYDKTSHETIATEIPITQLTTKEEFPKPTETSDQPKVSDDASSSTTEETSGIRKRKNKKKKKKLEKSTELLQEQNRTRGDSLILDEDKGQYTGTYKTQFMIDKGEKVSTDFTLDHKDVLVDKNLVAIGVKELSGDADIKLQLPVFKGPLFSVSQEEQSNLTFMESSVKGKPQDQSDVSGWKLQMPIIKMPKLPKLYRRSVRSESEDYLNAGNIISDVNKTDVTYMRKKDLSLDLGGQKSPQRYLSEDQAVDIKSDKAGDRKLRSTVSTAEGQFAVDESGLFSVQMDPIKSQTVRTDADQKVLFTHANVITDKENSSVVNLQKRNLDTSKPAEDDVGLQNETQGIVLTGKTKTLDSKSFDVKIRHPLVSGSAFQRSEGIKLAVDLPSKQIIPVEEITEGQDKDDALAYKGKTADEHRDGVLKMPRFKLPSFGSLSKKGTCNTEGKMEVKEEQVDTKDEDQIQNLDDKDSDHKDMHADNLQSMENKPKMKLPKVGVSLPKFKGHKGHYTVSTNVQYANNELEYEKFGLPSDDFERESKINVLDTSQQDVLKDITDITNVQTEKSKITLPFFQMPKIGLTKSGIANPEETNNIISEATESGDEEMSETFKEELRENKDSRSWKIQMPSIKIPKLGTSEKMREDMSMEGQTTDEIDAKETSETSDLTEKADGHFKLPSFKIPSLNWTGSKIKGSQYEPKEEYTEEKVKTEVEISNTDRVEPQVFPEPETHDITKMIELTSEDSDIEKYSSPFKPPSVKLPSFSMSGLRCRRSREESDMEKLHPVLEKAELDNNLKDVKVTLSKKKKMVKTRTGKEDSQIENQDVPATCSNLKDISEKIEDRETCEFTEKTLPTTFSTTDLLVIQDGDIFSVDVDMEQNKTEVKVLVESKLDEPESETKTISTQQKSKKTKTKKSKKKTKKISQAKKPEIQIGKKQEETDSSAETQSDDMIVGDSPDEDKSVAEREYKYSEVSRNKGYLSKIKMPKLEIVGKSKKGKKAVKHTEDIDDGQAREDNELGPEKLEDLSMETIDDLTGSKDYHGTENEDADEFSNKIEFPNYQMQTINLNIIENWEEQSSRTVDQENQMMLSLLDANTEPTPSDQDNSHMGLTHDYNDNKDKTPTSWKLPTIKRPSFAKKGDKNKINETIKDISQESTPFQKTYDDIKLISKESSEDMERNTILQECKQQADYPTIEDNQLPDGNLTAKKIHMPKIKLPKLGFSTVFTKESKAKTGKNTIQDSTGDGGQELGLSNNVNLFIEKKLAEHAPSENQFPQIDTGSTTLKTTLTTETAKAEQQKETGLETKVTLAEGIAEPNTKPAFGEIDDSSSKIISICTDFAKTDFKIGTHSEKEMDETKNAFLKSTINISSSEIMPESTTGTVEEVGKTEGFIFNGSKKITSTEEGEVSFRWQLPTFTIPLLNAREFITEPLVDEPREAVPSNVAQTALKKSSIETSSVNTEIKTDDAVTKESEDKLDIVEEKAEISVPGEKLKTPKAEEESEGWKRPFKMPTFSLFGTAKAKAKDASKEISLKVEPKEPSKAEVLTGATTITTDTSEATKTIKSQEKVDITENRGLEPVHLESPSEQPPTEATEMKIPKGYAEKVLIEEERLEDPKMLPIPKEPYTAEELKVDLEQMVSELVEVDEKSPTESVIGKVKKHKKKITQVEKTITIVQTDDGVKAISPTVELHVTTSEIRTEAKDTESKEVSPQTQDFVKIIEEQVKVSTPETETISVEVAIKTEAGIEKDEPVLMVFKDLTEVPSAMVEGKEEQSGLKFPTFKLPEFSTRDVTTESSVDEPREADSPTGVETTLQKSNNEISTVKTEIVTDDAVIEKSEDKIELVEVKAEISVPEKKLKTPEAEAETEGWKFPSFKMPTFSLFGTSDAKAEDASEETAIEVESSVTSETEVLTETTTTKTVTSETTETIKSEEKVDITTTRGSESVHLESPSEVPTTEATQTEIPKGDAEKVLTEEEKLEDSKVLPISKEPDTAEEPKVDVEQMVSELVEVDEKSPTESVIGKVKKYKKKITKVEKTITTVQTDDGVKAISPTVELHVTTSEIRTEAKDTESKEVSPQTQDFVKIFEEQVKVSTPETETISVEVAIKTEAGKEKGELVLTVFNDLTEVPSAMVEGKEEQSGLKFPTFKLPEFTTESSVDEPREADSPTVVQTTLQKTITKISTVKTEIVTDDAVIEKPEDKIELVEVKAEMYVPEKEIKTEGNDTESKDVSPQTQDFVKIFEEQVKVSIPETETIPVDVAIKTEAGIEKGESLLTVFKDLTEVPSAIVEGKEEQPGLTFPTFRLPVFSTRDVTTESSVDEPREADSPTGVETTLQKSINEIPTVKTEIVTDDAVIEKPEDKIELVEVKAEISVPEKKLKTPEAEAEREDCKLPSFKMPTFSLFGTYEAKAEDASKETATEVERSVTSETEVSTPETETISVEVAIKTEVGIEKGEPVLTVIKDLTEVPSAIVEGKEEQSGLKFPTFKLPEFSTREVTTESSVDEPREADSPTGVETTLQKTITKISTVKTEIVTDDAVIEKPEDKIELVEVKAEMYVPEEKLKTPEAEAETEGWKLPSFKMPTFSFFGTYEAKAEDASKETATEVESSVPSETEVLTETTTSKTVTSKTIETIRSEEKVDIKDSKASPLPKDLTEVPSALVEGKEVQSGLKFPTFRLPVFSTREVTTESSVDEPREADSPTGFETTLQKSINEMSTVKTEIVTDDPVTEKPEDKIELLEVKAKISVPERKLKTPEAEAETEGWKLPSFKMPTFSLFGTSDAKAEDASEETAIEVERSVTSKTEVLTETTTTKTVTSETTETIKSEEKVDITTTRGSELVPFESPSEVPTTEAPPTEIPKGDAEKVLTEEEKLEDSKVLPIPKEPDAADEQKVDVEQIVSELVEVDEKSPTERI
ncbi:protein AHNAK2 [Pyxicephalus adspersus]|uniref:protein AHNAK2 n=1 Tax=Pyxicephalus adspersus TaxID=30357 RepID=UPI003B59C0EF